MPITLETLDDSTCVSIDGELTIYTVAELAGALLPQMGGAPRLMLDLSQVTEMDGAGLQLLAVIQREAENAGTALSVTGQSLAVTQALDCVSARVIAKRVSRTVIQIRDSGSCAVADVAAGAGPTGVAGEALLSLNAVRPNRSPKARVSPLAPPT